MFHIVKLQFSTYNRKKEIKFYLQSITKALFTIKQLRSHTD